MAILFHAGRVAQFQEASRKASDRLHRFGLWVLIRRLGPVQLQGPGTQYRGFPLPKPAIA